mgnify:CR=1 FL=1
MSALSTWSRESHQHQGVTHPYFRKGAGPGVIVVHEVPGLTDPVIAFAEGIVAAWAASGAAPSKRSHR